MPPGQGVDIFIPSKDRPCQLHLLLSQLSKNMTGAGRIVITIQASSDEFQQGYELLKERVASDEVFRNLRESAEIVYHKRDSLAGIFDGLEFLGDSDYVLPLTDDEVFHRPYDLAGHQASQYFFTHPDVLACAVRLGKNITPEVPETHRRALSVKPQPDYRHEDGFLLWSWPDNMNAYHWSCIASTTGHIYRKKMYLKWFERHGTKNFLRIEGKAKQELMEQVYRVPRWVFRVIDVLDVAQQFLLMIGGVNPQDILRSKLSAFLFSFPKFRRGGVPIMMVAPEESVTTCLDLNTSSRKRGDVYKRPSESNKGMNQKYLQGEVVSTDFIGTSTIDEPNIRDQRKMGEIHYVTYDPSGKTNECGADL